MLNKFRKIIIAKNNQQIVDNCDWVILSVTPSVGKKILKNERAYDVENNITPINEIINLIK